MFVHQSFPGQYRHIVRALAHQGGHQIVAMGIEQLTEPIPESVQYVRYGLSRGTGADVHPLATEIEAKAIRGHACAQAAFQLREQGFYPDIICAHPGWGESLFRKIFGLIPLFFHIKSSIIVASIQILILTLKFKENHLGRILQRFA